MSEVVGGYVVVEALKQLGCEYIFGMPGFQLMSVYDGIHRSKNSPRHILVHDEKCGSFMAFGYARISGKPGVCDATAGPGATNLVSGLAEAYYSSTPLVAVTSDVRMEYRGKSPNQECDQTAVFRPIVKRSFSVDLPQRIVELTARSFQVALSGRPGPVHLNLPENIVYTPITYDWHNEVISLKSTSYPLARPRPEASRVERTVHMLQSAKRPVCIAGGGIHSSTANKALVEFVEKMQLPVATSLTGKGAIPETHPLALSVCGRFDRYANRFIAQSDLIFVIGCKLGELVTSRWSVIPKGIPIIHCDIDAFEIDRNYSASLGIVADAASTLHDLVDAAGPVPKTPVEQTPIAQEIAAARVEWENSNRNRTHSDEMPTNPARVLREIQKFLPDDGILVPDGGLATMWSGLFYDVKRAERGFVPNRGQAGIGCGFPSAMGVKLAAPEKAVVAFVGDGGFCQGISELETAAREHIPLIVVVLNNSCLGYIKGLQHAVFNQRYQSADFIEIRYDSIAKDFGCHGVRITSLDEILPELHKAVELGKPTVLDIATTRDSGKMFPKMDARARRC